MNMREAYKVVLKDLFEHMNDIDEIYSEEEINEAVEKLFDDYDFLIDLKDYIADYWENIK